MPVNNALTPEGQNSLGAAFGYFPQLRRNRTVQDPRLAADVPLQFLRGRAAATLGAPSDILNFLRSPLPMEVAGDVDYGPQVQVPYGSQELLRTLPLPPQGAAQAAAGNVGAVIPMSPAEALAAARAARQAAFATGRAVGPAAARMTEGYLQRQGLMPGVVPTEGRSFQAPQQAALDLAQQRAIQVGESTNPQTRMLQQGFEPDWYHGGTGDVVQFRPDLLGETTGAASAKKGFFFARDPQNPPAAMTQKTTDPESINFLKKLGKTDEEIEALNSVSMQGHGAETASGYAQIGGSREYKDAMRKAKSAEKQGNWDEYEKQMQIAEDSEINRINYGQSLVAKYGDARDEMLAGINDAIFSQKLPQAQAELLDAKVKQLMPYGWYNSYSNPQLEGLQKELVNLVGKDSAKTAIDKIKQFQSVRNERTLVEKTQEGGNVMPVALRYENPMVYDFKGQPYRDQSYSDLMDQAVAAGNDALILKNTFDPGGGPSKLIDVGVMFSPDQIRSRFAAFDPLRKTAATAAAAGLAAPNLLAAEAEQDAYARNELRKFKRQSAR